MFGQKVDEPLAEKSAKKNKKRILQKEEKLKMEKVKKKFKIEKENCPKHLS